MSYRKYSDTVYHEFTCDRCGRQRTVALASSESGPAYIQKWEDWRTDGEGRWYCFKCAPEPEDHPQETAAREQRGRRGA